jgi:hypothetical protein
VLLNPRFSLAAQHVAVVEREYPPALRLRQVHLFMPFAPTHAMLPLEMAVTLEGDALVWTRDIEAELAFAELVFLYRHKTQLIQVQRQQDLRLCAPERGGRPLTHGGPRSFPCSWLPLFELLLQFFGAFLG